MIFVDTSAWYACVMPTDPNHVAAMDWLKQNQQSLLTTDYIIDETLTLLKARGHRMRAVALGHEFFQGKRAVLQYLSEDDIDETWQVFMKFNDKDWSFTDCSSKIVIEKRGIAAAFAFDQHFHQFGTVIVVP